MAALAMAPGAKLFAMKSSGRKTMASAVANPKSPTYCSAREPGLRANDPKITLARMKPPMTKSQLTEIIAPAITAATLVTAPVLSVTGMLKSATSRMVKYAIAAKRWL